MAIDVDDLLDLRASVEASIGRERGLVGRLRSLSRTSRSLMLLALAAVLVAVVGKGMPREDLHAYPPARLMILVAAHALVLVSAAWLSLRPLYLPEARWLPRVVLAVGVLAPLLFALLPEVATGATAADRYSPAQAGWLCFCDGALLGGALLLLGRVLDRGGHLSHGPAALAAVAGGMTGLIALQLQCPFNYPLHLLAGHATIPIALLVGYRAFRI